MDLNVELLNETIHWLEKVIIPESYTESVDRI